MRGNEPSMVLMRSLAILSLVAVVGFMPFPSSGATEPGTCDVEGVVLDSEFFALEGAQVAILQLEVQTTTDASGSFGFDGVPAGAWTLVSAKLGYESGMTNFDCTEGETTQVAIFLQTIDENPPYVVLHVLQGQVGCGLGAYSISTSDTCGSIGLAAGARTRFTVPRGDDDITGAVYEAAWANTQPIGGCLSLLFPFPGAAAPSYTSDDRLGPGTVSGRSPLGVTIESGMTDPLYTPSPSGTVPFEVRPAGSTPGDLTGSCPVNPVAQQSFVVYLALFYNGADVPDGFTMVG